MSKSLKLFSIIAIIAVISLFVSCQQEPVSFTITFETNGGSTIPSQRVLKGATVIRPENPTKDGTVFFDAWYTDSQFTKKFNFSSYVLQDITLYAKWIMPTDESIYFITYNDENIKLDEKTYYLDATLTEEQRSPYNFTSLEDAQANLPNGSESEPVTLYIAPDVYWTDDPDVAEDRNKNSLVGITFQQHYLTFKGMSGRREDVIICSNRGNNAGAQGNFNTMAIANGFQAYDITFANYCNVDLEYELDSTKNRAKRQGGITQAQTLITTGNSLDKLYFENCSFVSRLNLLSLYIHKRAYFKDCHFESTDDSFATGDITIYENCDFDLYSGTPCATSSNYLQSFLGCTFNLYLSGNGKITLSKGLTNFAFIDCQFNGTLEKAEWNQNVISSATRSIVYNNKINTEDLVFSANNPETSIYLDNSNLTAFKVNDEYNIYNLLNTNGLTLWDPNNEATTMANHVQPWYVKLSNTSGKIQANGTSVVSSGATVYGYNVDKNITWNLPEDDTVLSFKSQTDTSFSIVANNEVSVPTTYSVIGKTTNGLNAGCYVVVTPEISGNATFKTEPSFLDITDNTLSVTYEVVNGEQVINDINPDESIVKWYRSTSGSLEDNSDWILTATSRYITDNDKPYKDYKLSIGDIDYYIICSVKPKIRYSNYGEEKAIVTSTPITSSNVTGDALNTIDIDFKNFSHVNANLDTKENKFAWLNKFQNHFWYGGQYLVTEDKPSYSGKINQTNSNAAWNYTEGSNGALGYVGYLTNFQGARLVYNNTDSVDNMALTLEVVPEKTAGQGFGGATQFMDIFIKYDVASQTGYGLRIIRLGEMPSEYSEFADYTSNACYFALVRHENGVTTILNDGTKNIDAVATAFNPVCTINLEYKDKVLSASVTTTKAKSDKTPESMPNEVALSYTLTEDKELFGGFGIQHTGTVSSGNRANIISLYGNWDYTK